MFKDLFTFDDCLDADTEYVELGSVTFLRDFGTFKKGDKVDCIRCEYDESTLSEVNEDGDVVKTVKFNIQPVVE